MDHFCYEVVAEKFVILKVPQKAWLEPQPSEFVFVFFFFCRA